MRSLRFLFSVESFQMQRRLFNTVLKMMPKCNYYIDGNGYKKLFVVTCQEIDKYEWFSVAHKKNMKRAVYAFISKMSLDNAYNPVIINIMRRVHDDNIRLG